MADNSNEKKRKTVTSNTVNTDEVILEDNKRIDPFSPSNLGLPVIITDKSGNRMGNVWSTRTGGLGEALSNLENGKATKLYFDALSNSFVNYPASSMSYKNGKISLNVANDVAKSDWYKRLFDNDEFEKLSILYKQDPTGETELEVSEKDENGNETKKKKTINEILAEYSSQLSENSKKYQSNIDTRTNVSRLTNGALELTDDDIAIMANFKSFSKESHGANDVVLLPDSVKDYFRDYDTYNEENGSISADVFFRDFYYYDSELPESAKEIIDVLGKGELGDSSEALQNVLESDKDYAIDLVRLRVSQEMGEIVERLSFYKDDLSESEKARYATEYVKCYSLYKTMTKDTPDSNAWTGFNLGVQNLIIGAGDQIITASEGILHVLSTLTGAAAQATVGTLAAADGVFSFLSDVITDFFEGGIDKVNENYTSLTDKVQESVSSAIGEGSIVGELNKSARELGEAMSSRQDLAGRLFESVEAEMALDYANAEAMQRIGRMAGYILTQIVITNPVGSAVGEAFSYGAANALSVVYTGHTFNTLANMASVAAAAAKVSTTAAGVTKYLTLLHRIGIVGRVIGFTANIYAQGVVDTLVENPALTDALIYGADAKTVSAFQDALRWNIVFNAAGEFVPFLGKGARKGAKFISTNTRGGAFTQAFLRKVINRITLRGRKIYEGVAEFMTDKVFKKEGIEEIIEQTDATSTATKKLSAPKKWQSLRRDIIKVQEDIKEAKLITGDGTVFEKAKIIDDLVQKRIDLETKLGISKKLAIAEAKKRIVKNAGLEIESAELSEQTADLAILSKKMRQTNLPGSFSKETGDYIHDLYNRQLLEAKENALFVKGKMLSKEEQEAFDILKDRIIKYEESLPSEYAEAYKAAANDYLDASYRFYSKLRDYLSSDAGGNIITKEEVARMKAGSYGADYMHQYAINGFKGSKDIEDLLSNPGKVIEQGKTRIEDVRFNKKMFSDEVTYFDPNYTRDMVLDWYARISDGIKNVDAVVRAGSATSIQVDYSGKILKSSTEIENAKNGFYKDLEKKFGIALREESEGLGKATEAATEKGVKKFWSKAKRSTQRTIKDILGLNKEGLELFAATMNSEQIHKISTIYSMPQYSAPIRTKADLQAMYDSLSPAQKNIVEKTLDGESLTISRWNYAIKNNNLDVELSRQYIRENSSILNSTVYKDIVAKAREESLTEEEALALRESKLKLEEIEEEISSGEKGEKKAAKKLNSELKKNVRKTVVASVDAVVEALAGSDNKYLITLVKEFEKAGVPEDLARRYIVYQWLFDNVGEEGVVQHIAFDFYSDYPKITGINANKGAAKGYSKNFRDAAESIIQSKLNKTVAEINEIGATELIDMESTVARTDKYLKDIADMYAKHNIIEGWNRETGEFVYYKVDRSTYNLVTNYPTFQNNNIVTRTLARLNAIARVGQITIRMASLVTQGFKDSFNAIILGGWDQLMLDNPDTYKKIAEYISQDVVDAFQKEMTPSAWQDFLAKAKWEGLSVEEAIAKSEVEESMLSTKIKGAGTSSSYFSLKNLYTEAEGDVAGDTWGKNRAKWMSAYDEGQSAIHRIVGWGDRVIDNASDRINFLHNLREEFLRKQVYRQNFMDALAMGKSLNQARSYAQYFMENATTNFKRGVAWGSQIVRSIPYFGAILNGASSMIRLLEVDPLGVMMRFTTDLVVPTVGLTVLSLQNDTDAEIYKNIPEWEKKSNLIWVVNGKVETVPLPEELAKFILPVRHAVELMHDSNENAWHELLISDLLNMPTIPLDAIMMLDDKKINGDPSVLDRISALALDMFNTLAPNAARTAYIANTGRDPYTGKEYGKVRLYEDANGEYQYMSTTEYDFCQDLANLTNGWGWNISALMAEGILNSMFGTGSLDLIEGIRDFISSAQQGEANFMALFEPSLERAGNVLTGTTRTDERQAEISWYSILNELKAGKNKLLAPDGKLAKYANDIDMASTASEKAKKTELYNAEVRNWQNEVLNKVRWYNSKYGDFYNRYKFASTLSYMTVGLSIDNIKDSKAYYSARAEAVNTLYDAGFRSPNDSSIFGYVYMNSKTGEVKIKYTDPLVVTLNQNLMLYQGDTALRQIQDAMEFSGLKDEYEEIFYPAYSDAMNRKDYTEANRLAADWDAKVIKEISPIIDDYTVDNLLKKSSVIDYLDNYIKVPSTTDAMGRGKYYSSKTGLSKNRGFAQSYIQKIYKRLKEKK